MAETSLHSQRGNSTSLKCNGKIDVTEGNTASLAELNLELFLKDVGDIVQHFSIDNFFYLLDSTVSMKQRIRTRLPLLQY